MAHVPFAVGVHSDGDALAAVESESAIERDAVLKRDDSRPVHMPAHKPRAQHVPARILHAPLHSSTRDVSGRSPPTCRRLQTCATAIRRCNTCRVHLSAHGRDRSLGAHAGPWLAPCRGGGRPARSPRRRRRSPPRGGLRRAAPRNASRLRTRRRWGMHSDPVSADEQGRADAQAGARTSRQQAR